MTLPDAQPDEFNQDRPAGVPPRPGDRPMFGANQMSNLEGQLSNAIASSSDEEQDPSNAQDREERPVMFPRDLEYVHLHQMATYGPDEAPPIGSVGVASESHMAAFAGHSTQDTNATYVQQVPMAHIASGPQFLPPQAFVNHGQHLFPGAENVSGTCPPPNIDLHSIH